MEALLKLLAAFCTRFFSSNILWIFFFCTSAITNVNVFVLYVRKYLALEKYSFAEKRGHAAGI